MIKAHAVIEFGSLVIFKKLYIKIRQLYHLSLYKQGPNLPRVTISLPHFPPKNVTSSYSAHKNVTFLSIFFFYVFFYFTNTKTFIVFVFLRLLQTFSNVDSALPFCVFELHCHFAFLLHACCLVLCFFSLPWEKNMEDNALVLLFYVMEDKWKLLMSPLLLMLLLISPLAFLHRSCIDA